MLEPAVNQPRPNEHEALESLARLLEVVGSTAPLSEQLNDLALYVERLAPHMRCSILLVDAVEKTLRVAAAPHLPDAYNAAIDGTAYGEGVGSCGTAAARRAMVVVADIEHSPLWVDFRDLARLHSLAACWSTPVIDTHGELLGTFAMYYDTPREPTAAELAVLRVAGPVAAVVVERHRDALRLRESEERFASVFEFAAIGMALVSPGGRWLRVNHALCRIVGYSSDELLRLGYQSITHPDDLTADLHFERALLEGKRAYYDLEKRYFHRDGHTIWILLSVSLVREASGAPLYFIAQIQDISDRKRLEEDLSELTSSEQQQLGRDLHDGLGQELTGLALMARAFATRAERSGSPLAADAGALSDIAMTAVASCRDIVRGVSPLTENKGGLVEGIRHLVDRASTLGGQRTDFKAFADVPLSLNWYSRNQLYRIAQEALNNAVQHSSAKNIEVQLSAHAGSVRLTIEDDGRGLPEYVLKRGGFGIDTMRYRAAAIHARFSIESKPGGGTLVLCDCPLPVIRAVSNGMA
jgi:PAS domain S-box-containing protein